MIQRREEKDLLCFPQPSHAWMSGQMADAWFDVPDPRPEICLGATQHDCGWVEWEEAPTFNPETGLPHDFLNLPASHHLDIWRRGPRRAAVQSRFAGLVVSLHGTGLYSRGSKSTDPDVIAYLDGETAWQNRVRDSLSRDPRFAASVTDESLVRIQKRIAAWDLLSLHLCRGIPEAATIQAVPFLDSFVDFVLEPQRRTNAFSLRPWPFRDEQVSFRCEAYRLVGTFVDEETMRAAIRSAPRFTPAFSFVAG